MNNIPIIHHANTDADGKPQFSFAEALDLAYDTKLPMMTHGTFGIGKSEGVKAWAQARAKQLGLEYSEDPKDVNKKNVFMCIVINLHHFDASGFWLPVLRDGRYFKQMDEMFPISGQGVIFFDELPLAPPLVQSNAYQFFLDKRLGQYLLPEDYLSLAAGNTVTDGAHMFEMATPLKNRMSHYTLAIPTVDEWITNYALPKEIDTRVQMFLQWQKGYIHQYDPALAEDVFGIPTPRSWAVTGKAIKGKTDIDKIKTIVAANVGVGIATEFAAWLKLTSKFDIDEIYNTEKLPDKSQLKEVDITYSLMAALMGFYQQKPTPQTSAKLFKLALQLPSEEYHIIMIRQAKSVRGTDSQGKHLFLREVKELLPTEFNKFSVKYIKYLMD